MFEYPFTAVHKALPSCMPEVLLAFSNRMRLFISARWGASPQLFRGFESRRMLFSISLLVWKVPETAKQCESTENLIRNYSAGSGK